LILFAEREIGRGRAVPWWILRSVLFIDCSIKIYIYRLLILKREMTISISKNVPSLMAMSLAIVSTLIAPAHAQRFPAQTTCTSSSPQCCWVVLSWQKMGKRTLIDPTSDRACCELSSKDNTGEGPLLGLPGVSCFQGSPGSFRPPFIIFINWDDRNLSGPIPSELANVVNLQRL
jgi:hypothetical protein